MIRETELGATQISSYILRLLPKIAAQISSYILRLLPKIAAEIYKNESRTVYSLATGND